MTASGSLSRRTWGRWLVIALLLVFFAALFMVGSRLGDAGAPETRFSYPREPADSVGYFRPGAGNDRLEFGLEINPAEMSAQALEARLDEALHAGVTTMKTSAVWWYMCPDRASACDYEALDRFVQGAEDRGLKASIQIVGSPSWLGSDAADGTPGARWMLPQTDGHRAQFADFVGRLAQRYQGGVARYEIWNEPNHVDFSYPDRSPERFARTLATAYTAIKAADPAALVTSGGLSRSDIGFLSHMLDALASLPGAQESNMFLDEVGIHPYSDDRSPWADPDGRVHRGPWGDVDSSFGGIDRVIELLDERGLGNKRLWLGEYGFSTTRTWMAPVPDERRAVFLMEALDRIRSDPRVAGMVWYAYLPHSATDQEWAIADHDGRVSVTLRALASYAHAQSTARVLSGARCPTGEVAARALEWAPDCLGLQADPDMSTDVFIDGVPAASGGAHARLPADALPADSHEIVVVFYPPAGVPVYSVPIPVRMRE